MQNKFYALYTTIQEGYNTFSKNLGQIWKLDSNWNNILQHRRPVVHNVYYTWVIDLIRLLGSGHLVGSQWSVAASARRNRVSEVMIDFQLWKEVLLSGGRSSLSKWATGTGLRRRPRRWPLLTAAQSAGPTWSRISLVMESSEETRVWEWSHLLTVTSRHMRLEANFFLNKNNQRLCFSPVVGFELRIP